MKILVTALLAAALAAPAFAQPIHQLRLYEIYDGNKQAFHERFRDHGAKIMARHGFKVLSIWETAHEGKTEFAYLLEWKDESTMKAAWAAFMADPEWTEIKRVTGAQHGRMVGSIEDRTLRLVDYSPSLSGSSAR